MAYPNQVEFDKQRVLYDIKEALSTTKKNNADLKEKLDKLEVKFEEVNAANDELTKKHNDEVEAKKVLEEKIKNLEIAGTFQGDVSQKAANEEADVANFLKYLGTGDPVAYKACQEYALKYYRTDKFPEGGVFVPVQKSNEIIKSITELSPVRRLSRVIPISSKAISFNRRTARLRSSWAGERIPVEKKQSFYGEERIDARKLQVAADLDWEIQEDADINILTQIRQDVAEEFADQEGKGFVNGNNVDEPEGLMVNPDIPEIVSGDANTIFLKNLAKMLGELKVGYKPTFLFNRRTLWGVLATEEGIANFKWSDPITGNPNTVFGTPYELDPNLDNVAAGKYPVLLGDFRKGYYIVDRSAITTIRIPDESGNVTVSFLRRVGGMVVQKEAFVKLKVSV